MAIKRILDPFSRQSSTKRPRLDEDVDDVADRLAHQSVSPRVAFKTVRDVSRGRFPHSGKLAIKSTSIFKRGPMIRTDSKADLKDSSSKSKDDEPTVDQQSLDVSSRRDVIDREVVEEAIRQPKPHIFDRERSRETSSIDSKRRSDKNRDDATSRAGDNATLSGPLGGTVERALGKQLEALSAETEHSTRLELRRARLVTNAISHSHEKEDIPPYSFANYKPIEVVRSTKGQTVPEPCASFSQEKAKRKTTYCVPITPFTSADDMPQYAHYVNVEGDFLAPNEPTLRRWPYFHDNFDDEIIRENLKTQYHFDIPERPRKIIRLLQAEKYESYVEQAMSDLDITWSDLLHFLLDVSPNVGKDADALAARAKRHQYCSEDFSNRDSKRNSIVKQGLPPTSSVRLAKAACLCENFQRMARFSLWHVVRRHLFDYQSDSSSKDLCKSVEQMTCKVCKRFSCAYHGELRQYESDDSDEEDSIDGHLEGDIINPPVRNFRHRVAFAQVDPNKNTTQQQSGQDVTKKPAASAQSQYVWEPDKRKPFYPCHHPGQSCEDAHCSCFQQKINCEKICGCTKDCPRRWAGCSCAHERVANGIRTMCFADDRCACYRHARECDPDLCGACRAHEVLDPVNRYNDSIGIGRCRNVSIQRAVPKHTVLGQSIIHGFGLFAGEDVRTHEFLGEYKGEIVTAQEAERRGAVYEHQKLSYLFCLNQSQEIDSTYFGNKIRFINHARESRANLYPRIVLVNTVHRIALYASRQIRKGNELFFDYGPKFPTDQLGGEVTENKKVVAAPRGRNSKVVLEEFHDIEVTEDEDGSRRARKALGKNRQRKGVAVPVFRKKRPVIEDDGDDEEEAPPPLGLAPLHYAAVDVDNHDPEQRLAAYNIIDGPADGEVETDDEMAYAAEHESDGYQDDEEEVDSNDDTEQPWLDLMRRPRSKAADLNNRSHRSGG